MKRLIMVVALLGALTATTAALGAGGRPITEKALGAANISQGYTIDVKKPADVIVAEATVPPGASFGWHYHRAAVAAVVKSGTLDPLRQRRPHLHRDALLRGRGLP